MSHGPVQTPPAVKPILSPHPAPPHPFGVLLGSSDAATAEGIVHRALVENTGQRQKLIECLRQNLETHHGNPAEMDRSRRHREAMASLGFEAAQASLKRFPTNSSTQKGNLAEVFLAEYVTSSGDLSLPVYRLRYNPNVDQSMKGDDVLAFDLVANPVRIVVGEAKFRATSNSAAVTEIVEGLSRSRQGGLPASLQFVADRLFGEAQAELGRRVFECAVLFAKGQLRIDYVGLLMSDGQSAARVHDATPTTLPGLAMISLGLDDPTGLAVSCYDGLA